HLDYVRSDAVPCQSMLKAKAFFAKFDPEKILPSEPTEKKVSALIKKLEDGVETLRVNRAESLIAMQKEVTKYLENDTFEVTSETQEGLRLK
nr:putative virulence factor [Nostoc sp. CHAB 5824]